MPYPLLLTLNNKANFCLGKHHWTYFESCDLFCSFYILAKIKFGGTAKLDAAMENYWTNLNSLGGNDPV